MPTSRRDITPADLLCFVQVDEGIRVLLTPKPNYKEPVVYWQCTACDFRSKAPSADALPEYVLFNRKHNVRYRWLFLANSHCSTPTSLQVITDPVLSLGHACTTAHVLTNISRPQRLAQQVRLRLHILCCPGPSDQPARKS